MKKTLSLLLSLIMIASVLFATSYDAFAITATGWCGEYIYYEYNYSTGTLNLKRVTDKEKSENNEENEKNGSTYNYSDTNYSPFRYYSGLKKVIIGNGITIIGSELFKECRALTSVTIPNSVSNICFDAFIGCSSLEAVNISNLEAWCKIKFNSSDSNPTKSAKNIYLNGNLITNLVIPNSITNINFAAFVNCTCLEKVTIPDSVTKISWQAFYGCTEMKELKIPCSTKIDNYQHTFARCGNIEKLTITKGNGTMQNYSPEKDKDDTCYEYTPWYVSKSKLSTVIIEDGVESIGNYAFYDCENITNLTIPCSTTINNSGKAFYNCSNIEKLTLTKGDGTMPNYSLMVLWGINYYQNTPPWYASRDKLSTVIIKDGVKNIGDYAFYDCRNIKSLTMPCSSEIYNSENTFYNCRSIDNLKLTKGTGKMPLYSKSVNSSNTYYQYTPWYVSRDSLRELNIEKGVKSVSNYAFYGCTNETDLYFYSVGCSIPSDTSVTGNAKIYGYYNSSAQDYAKAYSKKFISLGKYKCNSNEHIYSILTVVNRATTKQNGSIGYLCKYCNAVSPKNKKTIYRVKKITLPKTKYICNGKEKKPAVTVKDANGATLKKGTDYKVSYSNNKLPGSAKVKITFIGKYKGSVTKSFIIYPQATSITYKKSPSSGKLVIRWKSVKGASGYQIQASYDSSFGSGVSRKYTKKTNETLKDLIPNMKCYVQVRSYVVVNNKKHFSSWSKKESAKSK